MRKIVKSVVYFGVFMMLPASLAGYGEASASVTRWQGLCIPSARITSLQGSVFGEAIAHMKTDISTAPQITVEFSSQELARAIPGYKPDIPGHVGTIMAVTLELQPMIDAAKPHGYAYLSQGARNLWHLKGMSKNSSVKKIPSTNLYRITAPENQKYNDFFELVTRDLRKTNGKPVLPLGEWYVADCGQSNELGYTCNRHLVTSDFYVQYNFAKPNVTKLPMLDEFFRNKLKEWQAACKSR